MVTCTDCGEQNPVGTEFCLYCHAFLAWDEAGPGGDPRPAPRPPEPTREPRPDPGPGPSVGSGSGGPGRPLAESATETRMMPRVRDDGRPADGGASAITGHPVPVPVQNGAEHEHDLFRIAVEHTEVTVPAGGQPAAFALRVTNTSGIVDGYAITTPGAPDWLTLESEQISLLPGAEETLTVRLRAVAPTLVPAQQIRVLLRIASSTQPPAYTELPLTVTVPVVDAPVRVRAEPRLLKIRDAEVARFTVHVDNANSNRTARLELTGSDPELVVRFQFEPAVLELPPGGSGSAEVTVGAAGPDPGQEVARALTIAAVEGARTVETMITLQQATSVTVQDPMVELEVVPSVIRVRDRPEAAARLVIDNTRGREWAHVRLEASDPERAVRVSWEQPMLHVPPGRTTQTEVRFTAPLPEAGSETSRVITLSVDDGSRRASTTATFVQTSSTSPMTTLAIRLEPSVLKVQDADGAQGQVIIDNRRGASGLRIWLQGSDPESSMRFSFQQPVVDVGAGQSLAVAVRLDAWRPPPGEQATRPFTVAAGDGLTTVEATGTLHQVSSRNPIELLQVKLDPSVLQLASGRRGQLTAVLDNRNGTQAVRVRLRGDDPMNIVAFSFAPGEVEVPPGAVTTALVTVEAPRAPAGQELTRPIAVFAGDGRSETPAAEGSVVQSSPVRVSYARQIWRVLLTLLGGLLMIFGTLQPFSVGGSEEAAAEFDANEISQTFGGPDLLAFNPPFLPTAGLLIIVLAIVMMFGLTGPKGRLTRVTALFSALLVVGFSVAMIIFGVSEMLGLGAFLIVLGCVFGYVGGLLVRR